MESANPAVLSGPVIGQARRLVPALIALALSSCAADPYVAVEDWSLRTPDGKQRATHIPRRFVSALPLHPTTYVLAADVAVGADRFVRGNLRVRSAQVS